MNLFINLYFPSQKIAKTKNEKGLKQVRSNKDASEGRNDDRIAERLTRYFLQVVYCRLFAGLLQFVYRLIAGYLQSGIHISTFPVILCRFYSIRKNAQRTDRPTDRRTDGPTDRRTDGQTLI